MDVGGFVQENKRWLIGVVSFGLAFLIGSAVIGHVYDADAVRRDGRNAMRSATSSELYDRAALTQAQQESEQLSEARQRLQTELAFVQTPKYELAGRGAPDEYLFEVGRGLKQSVLNAAAERDVHVADREIAWEVPTGVDEIRGVLFGLELLDEATKRLFRAHDAIRAAHPDALGLRAMQSMKVEPRRVQRNVRRNARPGQVDIDDLVVQQRLSFQFQADEATCIAFLEACRQPRRALVIENWQMTHPSRPGEACTVKGTLQGIAFKEQ
jgi:hypothetical protein